MEEGGGGELGERPPSKAGGQGRAAAAMARPGGVPCPSRPGRRLLVKLAKGGREAGLGGCEVEDGDGLAAVVESVLFSAEREREREEREESMREWKG